MNKSRILCGYAAGTIMVLSSAMHTLMGWPGIKGELVKAGLPVQLMMGLQMAWLFGGMAMLVFGLIVLSLFRRAKKGEAAPAGIALAIGIGYFAYGVAEFIVTGFAPFTFIFIVPGALLLIAARPVRAAAVTG